MQNQEPAIVRLILLLTVPALAAGIVVFAILFSEFSFRSDNQQQRYGEATASQLARYIAPYVVENNLLSLNVVVSDLTRDNYIKFVAIYDDSNRLIAQAGREADSTSTFSTEITFQDSVVGFARVAVVNESSPNSNWIVALLLLVAPLVLLAWRNPLFVTDWLYERKPDTHGETEDDPPKEDHAENETPEDACECILVTRVRPAHHLQRHFDRLYHAAELYGGIVEQTTPEELVVHFDGGDAMFRAASTGLIIRELCDLLPGNIKFGATLALLTDETGKTRKSASYLASIAEGDLLVASGESFISERVLLQKFHHSLVDSTDLCRITSLANQALIDGQAKQLL